MPTYEYQCRTCNHRFETWQKMADEPLTICPECGGHIRRVLFAAGVVFKGSGFYKTDHAAKSAVGENASAKSSESNGTGAASEPKTSGESKSTESSEKTSGEKASESKVAAEAK